MVKKYAVVVNWVVVNIILKEDNDYPDAALILADNVDIGYRWDGANFYPPEETPQ